MASYYLGCEYSILAILQLLGGPIGFRFKGGSSDSLNCICIYEATVLLRTFSFLYERGPQHLARRDLKIKERDKEETQI